MQVFHTVRTDDALSILSGGFRDGVLLTDRPLGCDDGVEGDTVLSLEMSDGEFAAHEIVASGLRYRYAVVPIEVANRLTVTIHSHEFAGQSRRPLLWAIKMWRYFAE